MVAGYTTTQGRRYPHYICQTAQKRGVRACAGKQLSAEWIEKAVVAALYELAGRPNGERLYELLPRDFGCWEELEREEQRRIVAGIVEEISYDRRLQQGRIGSGSHGRIWLAGKLWSVRGKNHWRGRRRRTGRQKPNGRYRSRSGFHESRSCWR